MNNPVKLILGALLGAGLGAGVSKLAANASQPPVAELAGLETGAPAPRESLRERWTRAQVAGEAAKAAKEEELRAYFRTKVKDQQAMRENPTL